MKKCSLLLIVFVLLTFMTFMVESQVQSATKGKIAGKVTASDTGEPLPGANIVIEGTTLGAAADVDGDYFILNIPPGTYDLKASMMGYDIMMVTGVVVNVDQTTTINFVLTPTAIEGKEVVIVAEKPVIQLDVANTQTILRGEDMAALPLTNFGAILDKQAGLRVEDERGLFIRGSRQAAISLTLDGIETRDNVDNQVYTRVNPDEVEQAELLTGGFNAEYGNAGAGVINLISKEGGNSYAGTFDSKLSVPDQKHFGPSLKYYYDQYYDKPDFWVETAKAIKDDDAHYAGFKDRPELLRELYKWRMRDAVTKYGDKPDSYLSATFGGPIPLLKNTTFFTSVKQDRSYYLYYGPISYFEDKSLMAKITSSIAPSMKLNFTYRYAELAGPNRYDRRYVMEQYGISDRTDPVALHEMRYVIDSVEGVAWTGFGGWPYVDMMSISNRYRNQYGLSFTHALSPKTFYEINVRFSYFKVHGAPGTLRDTTATKTLVDPADPAYSVTLRGEYALAPDYHWPFTIDEPWGEKSGGTYGNFENSRDKNWTLKAMITSQVNKTNQISGGFEFTYTDLYKYELRLSTDGKFYDWNWHVYPKHLASWLSDKLEFEGMIANIGLRADVRIPSSNVIDHLHYPYDYHWAWDFMEGSTDSTITGPHYDPPAKVVLAPRLNVAHPIGSTAKIFFNYGHYYQEPPLERQYYFMRRSDKNGYWTFGNPELPFQKTVQYEIGYEQNIMNMFRIAATGFYQDNTNLVNEEIRYIGLSNKPLGTEMYTVDYFTYNSNYYQSARGFQFRIEKRVGRFWTGWCNYDYEIYSRGKMGFDRFYEDTTSTPRRYDYDDQNLQLTPMPRFNVGLDLHTPSQFGPSMGGFHPLANMNLNILFWWRSQPTFTYNPGELNTPYDPRDNKRWKAHHATNLVFTKRFPIGALTPILYVEVYNLFNAKNMFRGAFTSGQLDKYLGLLEKEGGKPGEREDIAKEAIGNDPKQGPAGIPYDLYLNPRQILFGLRLEWR